MKSPDAKHHVVCRTEEQNDNAAAAFDQRMVDRGKWSPNVVFHHPQHHWASSSLQWSLSNDTFPSLNEMVTLLSILDQILWTMNRITWKLPPIASNPIVDRFGPINRDHLLLATGSRQELTAEQRQCWDSHSFHPPLSAVRPRFSSPFTNGQCYPRLQLWTSSRIPQVVKSPSPELMQCQWIRCVWSKWSLIS